MPNKQQVAEIRELLEAKTIACSFAAEPCTDQSHGDHRHPDSLYAGLLNVMRAECKHSADNLIDRENELYCGNCEASGFTVRMSNEGSPFWYPAHYVTRDWDMPTGAFAGAVSHALILLCTALYSYERGATEQVDRIRATSFDILNLSLGDPEIDNLTYNKLKEMLK